MIEKIRIGQIYWRRKVFQGNRRRGLHKFPGTLTPEQVAAIKDMVNIANWFMDVEVVTKQEIRQGAE